MTQPGSSFSTVSDRPLLSQRAPDATHSPAARAQPA
jgi:hypothetical protein